MVNAELEEIGDRSGTCEFSEEDQQNALNRNESRGMPETRDTSQKTGMH